MLMQTGYCKERDHVSSVRKRMTWKNRIKSGMLSFVLLFCFVLCGQGVKAAVSAEEVSHILWQEETTVSEGNLEFTVRLSEDGAYAWLIKVKQIEKKAMSALTFPEKIKGAVLVRIGHEEDIDGDDCRNIWGSMVEPYHNYDCYGEMPQGIETVEIPSTVAELYSSVFCGFRDLVSITIPDGVETIPYGAFYNCQNLEEVVLPSSLKTIGYEAFKKCRKLTKVEISSKSSHYLCRDGMLLSKDQKTAVWAFPGKTSIEIPEGVETVRSSAFQDSFAKKVSIPSSVKLLEAHALTSKKIRDIELSEENKVYAKSGNCIYHKKNKSLAVSINRDGTLILPEEVAYLTREVSSAGKAISKLVIPESFQGFRKNCFSRGIHTTTSCKICFLSKEPPKAVKGSFSSFSVYYVPEKSLKKYQKWYCRAEGIKSLKDGNVSFAGY